MTRDDQTRPTDEPQRERPARIKWALAGFLLIAGYFLFTEHRAHALEYLPFALLALCPLLHLFHGHGGAHDHPPREGSGAARTGSERHV